MLKTNLLHPEILHALAGNGHGAMLLIADGNYPFTTGVNERAKKVYLNLSPGILNVADVLKVIKETIPIESYIVMVPPDDAPQPIHDEFIDILGSDIPVEKVKRFDFYSKSQSQDTFLVIATGERRRFANILLVIGVVKE
ncbi:MAG: RbsD/FucU family protein [Bacteroidales bacterium]